MKRKQILAVVTALLLAVSAIAFRPSDMKRILLLFGFLLSVIAGFAQDAYTIKIKESFAKVQSTLWGLFFEDINRAADGGIYAEMVENRSFDFTKPMTAWTTWPSSRLRDGIFLVINQSAENTADPKYIQVNLNAKDTVGRMNSGFDEGMAFKKLPYNLTLRYRQVSLGVHIRIFLFNAKNSIIGRNQMTLDANAKDWHNQEISITPTDTATKGKLLIIFEGAGKLDVDQVSLFPSDTWKNCKGGLRADLVQKLADLKPGFLRWLLKESN